MKSRTLMALAVAGTFAAGGAFAGGTYHGAKHGSMHGSVEVVSPSSVSESAPWLANEAHSAGWSNQGSSDTIVGMHELSDAHVGASSAIGGSGQGGFDSMSTSGFDSLSYDYSLSGPIGVEYWLWGSDSEPYGTGASSSIGGSGSGGFDSSSFSDSSFEMGGLAPDDSFGGEQYLVWGPLSEADAGDLLLVEADSDSYSPVTLSALSEGYTLLTPIYDEMADASSFSEYQVSQYSPLSGEEDLAT